MSDYVPPDDRISAYLDGALSTAEHYMVLQLLVASPEWRKELDEISWARVSVRVMPAKVAPPGFFEDLLRDGLQERDSREAKGPSTRARGRSTRRGRARQVEPVAPEVVDDEPEYDDADEIGSPGEGRTELPDAIEEMPFVAAPPGSAEDPDVEGPPIAPPSPEEPLPWDRPFTPAGPPSRRRTRREIVAAKEAALSPAPVRRDEGDASTLWGKPPPRRQRPPTEAPVAEVAPVAPVAEVQAPASESERSFFEEPNFVEEPISIEEARAARAARPGRTLRWAAGVAAAAAVVIAAVVVPARGSVDPPVPEFAGAHSVRSSVTDDPVMQLAAAPLQFGR